jgi:hypothetical protein
MVIDQDDQDRMAWCETQLLERRIKALAAATMLPHSFDKRFVRSISTRLPESLSDRQKDLVLKLAWKYRRQIGRSLAPIINPEDPFADPRTGIPLMEFRRHG